MALAGMLRRLAERRADLTELRGWLAYNIWRLLESSDHFDRMGLGELDLAVGAIDRGETTEEELAEVAHFVLEAAQLDAQTGASP